MVYYCLYFCVFGIELRLIYFSHCFRYRLHVNRYSKIFTMSFQKIVFLFVYYMFYIIAEFSVGYIGELVNRRISHSERRHQYSATGFTRSFFQRTPLHTTVLPSPHLCFSILYCFTLSHELAPVLSC